MANNSGKREVRGVVTSGGDEEHGVEMKKETGENTEDETEVESFGCCYWPGGPTIVNVGTHESPSEIIGGSAYLYFLMPNLWAFLLALVVVAFQLYLFIILWRDGSETTNQDFRSNDYDYVLGLAGAVFMLGLRNLPHIGQGFELLFLGLGLTRSNWHGLPTINANTRKFDIKLVFVGTVYLLVSALCVATGLQYALNRGSSIIRTITSTTVAVFIENIDESMFSFLKYWSTPSWHAYAMKSVENKYGSRGNDE